jgi:hypothetical protein
LNLYIFTFGPLVFELAWAQKIFWAQAGSGATLAPWRFFWRESKLPKDTKSQPDNAKQTGSALEAHFQFLKWLAPVIGKLPKDHKFTLGDRIYGIALDITESLIEATYTRERQGHLRRANLGIEKLRVLIRLASALRLLDRRRYEYAARSLDETGRLIGGWMKAHHARDGGTAQA